MFITLSWLDRQFSMQHRTTSLPSHCLLRTTLLSSSRPSVHLLRAQCSSSSRHSVHLLRASDPLLHASVHNFLAPVFTTSSRRRVSSHTPQTLLPHAVDPVPLHTSESKLGTRFNTDLTGFLLSLFCLCTIEVRRKKRNKIRGKEQMNDKWYKWMINKHDSET